VGEEIDFFLSDMRGPTCHSDEGKFGAVPNAFPDLRSTVELLHGETP
jgi:hypothetical protein